MASFLKALQGDLRLYRGLSQLWKKFPFLTAAVALSSVFRTFCEGFSILLLLPFLESIQTGKSFIGPRWLASWMEMKDVPGASKVRWIAAAMTVAILLRGIAEYGGSLFSARLRMETLTHIRNQILDHFRSLGLREFYRFEPGAIVSLLLSQSECFLAAIDGFHSLLRSLLLIAVYALLLANSWISGKPPLIHWQVLLPCLVLVMSSIGLSRWISARVSHFGKSVAHLQSQIANLALDEIEAMPVIHAFNLTLTRKHLFHSSSHSLISEAVRMNAWLHMGRPVIHGMSMVVFFCVVWTLSREGDSVVEGAWIPLFISLSVIFYRLQGWISELHSSFTYIAEFRPAVESILEMVNQRHQGPTLSHSSLIPGPSVNSTARIQLLAVSFEFEPGRPVIQEVHLEIRPGEMVALVGPSGSGKTTIAHLSAGLLPPQRGEVFLCGKRIDQVSREERAKQIGVAFEKSYIFNESIEWNIRCGRELSKTQIEEAARDAGALQFIRSLPEGFKTQVGYQGFQLSNGQRQRIALARALAGRPSVLILDEATSALDLSTERQFHHFLETYRQKTSILVISHRLHSIEHADRILVVDSGRVIAEGPHHELIRSCELYQRMHLTRCQAA